MAQHAVGQHLYVFTRNAAFGNPATNECIIEAHGCQTLIPRTFPVPVGSQVTFYCPHGSSLIGTSIPDIAEDQINDFNSVTGGNNCHDYELGKFQGYHANGFTGAAPIDKLLSKCSDAWRAQMTAAQTYTNIDNYITVTNPAAFDVVTVRYRPMKLGITLSEVITQLRAAGYNYTNHHCPICRNHPAVLPCCTPVHDAANN